SLNASDAVTLQISGGSISAASGQTITLDFEGTNTVQMSGGSLNNVINNGNFQFTGGSIGNLINTPNGVFNVARSGSGLNLVAGLGTSNLLGSGSQTVSTLGSINNSGKLEITPGSDLIVDGNLSGTGALQLDSSSALQLAGAGNSTQSAISIAPGAQLDVGAETLTIAYGGAADPIASIQSYLGGSEIISSTIAKNFGLAAIDSPGQISIDPALDGDANLSGSVDSTDVMTLLENYGQPGGWEQGNFAYDPTIDLKDLELLLSNLPASADLTPAEQSAIQSLAGQYGDEIVTGSSGSSLVSIPEPASISLLACGSLCLLSRRRARS
ncbi:MAG TPA: hypothetical protein VL992_19030, partial [Tepidisphaeraceae bacterium]|nr:hypothetical protein [Tepidisphaeraceae bacterium]